MGGGWAHNRYRSSSPEEVHKIKWLWCWVCGSVLNSDEHTSIQTKPDGSWKVLCLVRENQTTFSGGYSKLAREYPLMVGDKCTFKLIKPLEFVLLTSKKTREDIDHYMID
ncbi:predicted protein [Arabidopsis lyrata subsp. lyrata]|uniref:Predicted protein n=1 Tax=Arabidopsis lyrata subsp. lyrata TaxID=81972 RepID=D7LT50_ARALL|nr:predicted protein [Arabidopsis lyrata subsp. lyrata]